LFLPSSSASFYFLLFFHSFQERERDRGWGRRSARLSGDCNGGELGCGLDGGLAAATEQQLGYPDGHGSNTVSTAVVEMVLGRCCSDDLKWRRETVTARAGWTR
jgi:hypothetical protein